MSRLLTFMATISYLVEAGALYKLDPQLAPRQQEDRMVYTSPLLKTWIEETLPTLASNWNLSELPIQQLDSYMASFASGDPLIYVKDFRPLNPIGQGVWELKTADLRIFGWFYRRDCFIGVQADTAWRVKESRMYHAYREATVRFRDFLDLDNPKFIPGDEPNDVVSNCCFS
jgi:hypothetical protein